MWGYKNDNTEWGKYCSLNSNKLPSGYSVSTPSSSTQSSIRSTVNTTKNKIISYSKANKIPGSISFDIY